ncbi:methylmalonic aciduria and homocystinuria type D protein [Aetokthonos hydrillicola Thurmond2011]|uniref:Methylmalonic aciduria and homocystinuria type D protein n=1 Tax=Aetokthonos hydrillicola Thurmond2011 TaxID=2712845 RepID=A0AAP5M6G1_9CYAN|nr:methylmalonic aciduria and homocystinuria type D protein [Aetokthonos hydrillicola]MBO3461839.1 methylmalonic aciduria and homocystinuria type D protein [Aetokthonos hydrillicola CCALA 1050]MBW4588871.1 methylmalonic aciduria and homocystinuria type D protein [Aetokthonos hydrillicola CCALA 1050]MDR9894080.1 methylmalonic aciduria and homocystinuria type D protein [Aetokthonos hydrillicola Thurmond2011]
MKYPKAYTSVAGCLIGFVGKTGRAVQISIHPPSQYICANCERVLPDWKNQLSFWVVIVLQQSQHELVESTPEIETEKQRLREKFMRFGCDVAFNMRDRGYLTDLIDPRTGYPLLSRIGSIPHDDIAVVKALLNYPVMQNKCRVLIHPDWGMAVYPSILMSAASPIIIEWFITIIAPLHGWEPQTIN